MSRWGDWYACVKQNVINNLSFKARFKLINYVQTYRNDPKVSDRQLWVNSEDPDQTAPRGAV